MHLPHMEYKQCHVPFLSPFLQFRARFTIGSTSIPAPPRPVYRAIQAHTPRAGRTANSGQRRIAPSRERMAACQVRAINRTREIRSLSQCRCTLAVVMEHVRDLLHLEHHVTAVVDGWDTTGGNLDAAPAGQGATYTTGSDGIAATAEQLAARPGIVRICQDAGATDDTADVLDIETGAATIEDAPGWIRRASESFRTGKRPGQREPALYMSAANVAKNLAALKAAKVAFPVWLWVARWGVTRAFAANEVEHTSGPLPECGFQYHSHPDFDEDVWAPGWLANVSKAPDPKPAPKTPATWEDLVSKLPDLKQGDKGANVRTLQGLLVARHYHIGTTGKLADGIDGDFGALTDSAVRDLQDKNDLKVTGTVDSDTWPVLAGV